ncbi:MAG: hypothetical protein GTN89_11785 [Acidobacteria bacterium]|nr:hypothetical protein [Acidobacteriota bacterium]NIM60987.1 hypothetical protein [Acidobacteriota bacterium]NIO59955.1 hypothetical protein [Acidobacteriota bacterium]NIQ31027.1 hypothetical protein [Acidobacteriota bacterium]NIQ86155.1 hypothetical protein [Acidobacteriota bacterium]
MRFAARLVGVLLLGAGLTSCDKDEIAQLEAQMASITIEVVGTDAELFNVWEIRETTDLDGIPGPDDPTAYLWCESQRNPVNPQQFLPRFVDVTPPWNYGLRISILRADATEFEQLTDDLYLNPAANLSEYDELFNPPGTVPGKNDLTVTDTQCAVSSGISCLMDSDCPSFPSNPADTCTVPVMRSFTWSRVGQMTSVNRTVLLATFNPLSAIPTAVSPPPFGYASGLCSVSTDPGPASLAGGPQPFTLELGKGDTIKVEARKAIEPPMGLRNGAGGPLTLIEPVLVGRLSVDGINITRLGGDPSSQPIPGDGISFFYSSR